ncbi:MAG: DNA polymerase III subunit alpha [Deltaproteobacteria bacterium]|jgi:DNA polymerase-3 subunit alpha|nr:DNA polymerase III subunit alpha [Deltaproteobacteria bacterium]
MSFVHLHVHSCYSLLDGAIRIKDLVNTAKEMQMPAVALTDHGQMMGLWAFYNEATEAGIKPILGVETYVANHGRDKRDPNESRHHLILLAQNMTGYQNLCRLISRANREGFYNKPRADKDLLAEYNEGLIALSGCLQGELAQEILRGSGLDSLAEIAQSYSRIFPGRFYLEIQENGLPQQIQVNETLIELAEKVSLPLVATNDCHYLKKEHHKAHDILLCIQTRKKLTDENRMRMESEEFYFKSPQEMAASFSHCPEALANTLAIAESCQLTFPKKTYHYPTVQLDNGETAQERLLSEAKKGFDLRLADLEARGRGLTPEQKEEYRKRLEYELAVINDMGFPGYFLIVADFIRWAREHDIMVGPGRGSAAGSLVAWSLGIISVDPIRYDLLFERFLNPERKTMPDIDVDFCAEGRGEVIRYVTDTYGGSEYVAQIITIGQMKAKAVIRDVGRVLGLDYREVDGIAKLIPNKLGITIDESLEQEPKLGSLANSDPRVQSLLDYARLLENLPRHASVHASGVVIGDRPLMDYLPLYCDTKMPEENGLRTSAITQYELNGVEQNGLVKFDFLGLKTMTLIKHCLALLAKKGLTMDLESLDFDDKPTFELLCSGQVNGVFQLESSGIRKVLLKMKPKTLEDISILLALYRPGPIEGGHVDDYVEIRHGRKETHIDLPQMVPVLKETNGVIIYQEQVMRLCQVLAGYSMGQADLVRRAMGKKDTQKMAELKTSFLEGAKKAGTPLEAAAKAFDYISKFANYGFNKSHSLAYAILTYRTAWLKAHYRPEFMAALLTSEMGNHDKIGRFIDDCRRDGLNVLPPDVNTSEYPFSVKDGDIIYGLGAIKGVGQGAVEAIVQSRQEKPYEDLFDFCQRVDSKKVNRRTMEALILSGSFDSAGGVAREVMKEALSEAMKMGAAGGSKKTESGLFDLLPAEETFPKIRWPKAEPMSQKDRLNYEKEYLGVFLSGHPLAPYEASFKALSSMSVGQIRHARGPAPVRLAGSLCRINLRKDKKGRDFAFATIEDLDNSVELFIWNNVFEKCSAFLTEDSLVYLEGQLEQSLDDKFGNKIRVDLLMPIDAALKSRIKSFYIRAQTDDLAQVGSFLTSHLKDRSQSDPQVWVGVMVDSNKEVFYSVEKTVELNPAFLDSALKSMGLFGEVRCLLAASPFGHSQ